MNKLIPIFYTVNENYAPYLSVSIASLIDNADKNNNYVIHIIHENLTTSTINKIKLLEADYAKIEFLEMKKSLDIITDRIENQLRKDYFTLTIYYRIFLPSMFLNYDKGLYLDCDTVVADDISKLYKEELEDNLFAGCNDISVKNDEVLGEYFEKVAGVDRNKYINSGVLLMNMKKLREVKFEEHFLYLLNKYHFDTVAPDQDYINAMAFGKIKLLDNVWDAMPSTSTKPLKNPSLIHYNLFFKPWHFDNIDYEEYFWKYADISLFKEEILNEKKKYTKEKQIKDIEGLNILTQRAKKIINNELTFKKIFESSIEKRI